MIREALAGKRIAVTGATGFLGTALVERLLRAVPECEVAVLVRPTRRSDAAQRLKRDLLRNDCFDRLRSQLGSRFEAEMERRLQPMGGDVSIDGLGLDAEGMAILASCDIVIHSAATVSFDSPLDAAVEVNLLGPSRVASAIAQASRAAGHQRMPHLIAVSTAYVAGRRKGPAPEALLSETAMSLAGDVSWQGEVAAARRARGDIEAESRRPERLEEFARAASRDIGGAGAHLLGERTERRREDWVREQMVAAGRSRAQTLGWPDAYAYTKSFGERALLEGHPDQPITIVRPSIIESALAQPYPGWIRGFRMAEPVIISYARGLLREFPGVPEGIIDVIPVDLVVAAIIAVAASGPPRAPQVFQVASGSVNPLRYGRLVDLVQAWFTENPLYDSQGQPVVVPEWSFPGRGRVQRQLNQANTFLKTTERLLSALPLRGRQASWVASVEDRRGQAERALGYVELYGAYAETEAVFEVERLLELFHGLPEEDKREFCFDPNVILWDSYVRDVHLPSVVAHARVRTRPGARVVDSREVRNRRAVLDPARHLAAFDLENTLIASNVVESYAWLASRRMGRGRQVSLVMNLLREAPRLASLDRRDRGDFLRSFYRRYAGAQLGELQADAWDLFNELLCLKAFPEGIRRVRAHRALGHRTLLITGALDVVVEPLRPLFDDIVCAKLGVVDGKLTGELLQLPPTGEARATLVSQYAASHGLRLEESVAYADSASDLPLLEAVGHPVAINPEAKLSAIARRRGWLIEHWSTSTGAGRPWLPLARPLRDGGHDTALPARHHLSIVHSGNDRIEKGVEEA